MKKLNISIPGFFDKDIACLFRNIECTSLTCVQCAVFLQVISRLIQKSGKKSVLLTVFWLHKTHFPYLSYSMVKRILQRLRRIGVLKTRIEYKRTEHMGVEHRTRIWVQDARIFELAEQVKRERGLGDMAKKLDEEK